MSKRGRRRRCNGKKREREKRRDRRRLVATTRHVVSRPRDGCPTQVRRRPCRVTINTSATRRVTTKMNETSRKLPNPSTRWSESSSDTALPAQSLCGSGHWGMCVVVIEWLRTGVVFRIIHSSFTVLHPPFQLITDWN